MKKIICVVFIFILVTGCISVLIDYSGLAGEEVVVSIPQGSGATEIVEILEEKKIISFPFLFTQYIKKDAAGLKAGVHCFKKRMGYKDALEELKKDVPLENSILITIPEGYEAREIATLLEMNGIVSASAFDVACKTAYTRYSFLPSDGNVEGYLFPATYEFLPDSSPELVVDKMLQTFSQKMVSDEIINRTEELNMEFHEVLTLASIIEREAAKDEERALVSSVFHNRLRKNMRLESCATVQYILKERKDVLSVADTKIDSVYNTYRNEGLPPAPISSPGKESLHAALYPKESDYLFFVADGNGGHTFSKTYDEHKTASR